MKIENQGSRLLVSELTELNATNAAEFRDQSRAMLTSQTTVAEVDLSATRFLDSSGLGALIALHKTMVGRGGNVRILNPTPAAQQVLELTRLHRILEIVKI